MDEGRPTQESRPVFHRGKPAEVRQASLYCTSRLVMFTRKSGLIFSAGSIS